ncbi:uncharacterized protein LOC133837285 [Drosophila sulfurigaster albostrigata]|uniref:uncharacterized protein LOC133837285 n=1 Tax=Drosophila sulfurigaster albostrigata TaxID=89887 RepID=UPI002D21C736|nr:uncharacterized protein LOC133837285 [Drosophila sulfurigaster albostrigata]
MAKVYLFRQLTELNQQQSQLREEAISSVLDDVFKGSTSSVFNYCDWPDFNTKDNQCDAQDLLGRLLNALFSRVYALEARRELNIGIKHVLIDGECKRLSVESSKSNSEHFVASAAAAYLYMRRVVNQLSCNSCLLFTICVRQTKLEQTLNLNGKLQLLHLQKSNLIELATPIGSLMKHIVALAQSEKTHLRYYNIKLEALLKELLGQGKYCVIINYTILPEKPQKSLAKLPLSNKLWRALYKRQFRLYKIITEQLKGLEFWSCDGQQLQLHELQKSGDLKFEVRKCQIKQEECEQHAEQQPTAFAEMQQIKLAAKDNIDNMLELQDMMAKLASNMEQHMQQLEQKNKTISRLHELLAKANDTVQEQRELFQRNLAFYAEMFERLWQQQSHTLRLQEQQRDEQLSQMFDTICNELHSSLLPETTLQLDERCER